MSRETTTDLIAFPFEESKDVLTPILRDGARKMLAMAIEIEGQGWIEQQGPLRDEGGRRLVVRNGYQPARTIQTGVGDVEVVKRLGNFRSARYFRTVFRAMPAFSAAFAWLMPESTILNSLLTCASVTIEGSKSKGAGRLRTVSVGSSNCRRWGILIVADHGSGIS